jgi:hypothetical protein
MNNPTNPDKSATQTLADQQPELPVQPIRFQSVDAYTTFKAEYAIVDGDLVFHFYVTPEIQKMAEPHKYWLQTFPAIIDPLAKDYFKAEFPKLKAAYTEEKASWWMRAFGFGMVLEPHQLAFGLFDKLDAALDEAVSKGTT